MLPNEIMRKDVERTERPKPTGLRKWLGGSARFLLGLLILALSLGVAFFWMTNKPKARRRPPDVRAALVEVQRVHPGTHAVTVEVLGTVEPVKRVALTPRVSGEIIQLSPELVPGGQFKAGDVIVKIDPTDYHIALKQKQAELARRLAELEQKQSDVSRIESEIIRADAALALERGQQDIAKREYELLGKTVTESDRELVLRQPQLKTAEAACKAARASRKSAEAAVGAARTVIENARLALERAKLDLARTTIRAPFNSVVESRDIDLGSQVSTGTRLATLVGTDEYWVNVSVPVDQLRWISIPRNNGEEGSSVCIYHKAAWGKDAVRVGNVVRLKAELEPEGRMARVLVSVKDPLGRKDPESLSMILNAYVRVAIKGRVLRNVIRVPRSALRDGTFVWIMSSDNTLSIREVAIAWSGNDHVYVSSGLREGDQLVTSDVSTPVEGMKLRTLKMKTPTDTTANKGRKGR